MRPRDFMRNTSQRRFSEGTCDNEPPNIAPLPFPFETPHGAIVDVAARDEFDKLLDPFFSSSMF